MNWREAFLLQARSDFKILENLNTLNSAYCHRLHYLQMVTEKLGKALMTRPDAINPPSPTHATFVRALQVLKNNRTLRERLGYADVAAFRRFIDSLLATARRIEELAPALAGFSKPNPEYPWKDTSGTILVPANFPFPEFAQPEGGHFHKLDRLVRALLRVLN